jgi:tetraacyldisaccharide 4'-kinase
MHQYWRELVSGKRQGSMDRLLLVVLRPLGYLYGAVLQLRAWLYARGLLASKKLPRPVISVGNLTVGGTGKTPAVLLLARLLMERSLQVAVLTRGYGGTLEGETRLVADGTALLLSPEEAGDEPVLLARSLPGLQVVMGPDRFRAGLLAMERFSPDIFILDDGYQHLRLQRDLNILLLDAENPFGNGRTLPAGLLREPASAANRAALVLYTRSPDGSMPDPDPLPMLSSVRTSHVLAGWSSLSEGVLRPFTELRERRLLAFAGIANPAGFFDSLEAHGVTVVATIAFPDHTAYGTPEMEAIGRLKLAKKADGLITTAKDAVKLQKYRGIIGDCLVAALELKLHDPAPLVAALEKLSSGE